jgi:hypothetical protein
MKKDIFEKRINFIMNFKDIPGYEGLYQISECGKVKSFKLGKEKILKTSVNKNGYEQAKLRKDSSQKTFYVHRLVIESHSHIDKDMTVNHIDENKLNNHISNLEYCTRAENIRKFNNNNSDFVSNRGKIFFSKMTESEKKQLSSKAGKIGGKKSGEARAKLWKYVETGEIYNTQDASYMMYDIGNADGKWVWYNILRNNKPQDMFIRI